MKQLAFAVIILLATLAATRVLTSHDATLALACDGTSDDTPVLQAAIDAAPSTGGVLHLPLTTSVCVITKTVVINGKTNFKLTGAFASGHSPGGTRLGWSGPSGGTVILLDGTRDSMIEYIKIVPQASGFDVGIDIDTTPAAQGISTNNHLRHVSVVAASGYTFGRGVRVAHASTQNNDLHVLEDIDINGNNGIAVALAGIEIDNNQAKRIQIVRGSIAFTQVAILQNEGSFVSTGTNFSHNATDIELHFPDDTQVIRDCQSEGAGRFLNTVVSTASAQAVLISGCRVAIDGTVGDGQKIIYLFAGPLMLMNNDFSNGHYAANWSLRFDPWIEATLTSLANKYPNESPFLQPLGNLGCFTSLGDEGHRLVDDHSHILPLQLCTL